MALTTVAKTYLNHSLRFLNLRVDTLTAERHETYRLQTLDQSGHFAKPQFSLPMTFDKLYNSDLLDTIPQYQQRFDAFQVERREGSSYNFNNHYFTSPDAEVLYTIVREHKPQTVIEVGCGNSTKLFRQAINDGHLDTHLISIDPKPRLEVAELADTFISAPVETLGDIALDQLRAGDILFIDSSHAIEVGNDVIFLYLQLIPKLPEGVLIHIHDIFLPYDYPRDWVINERWGFTEQYLVQALLIYSDVFDVIWAGYYLQQNLPQFNQLFPHAKHRTAKSLWLRKHHRRDRDDPILKTAWPELNR